MKKLATLVCMITCIFGLTACGSEENLTDYEQQKVDYACQVASQQIVPLVTQYADGEQQTRLSDYTSQEIEYMIGNNNNLNIDGYAFLTAIDSFESGLEEIGAIVEEGETTAQIDDDQIIVHVAIKGKKKDADAEVILSNDMFMKLESAALNPTSSMGQLMGKAALNTVVGMGTVFAVLILISFIISGFSLIPKVQAKFSKKKEENKTTGIDNAVAQIVGQEEIVDETDDLELVAVIAAAIAASEGAVSTDGFVVRSIRKVNRARR